MVRSLQFFSSTYRHSVFHPDHPRIGQKDHPNTSISAYLAQHSTTTFLLLSITYTISVVIPFVNLARAARGLAGKGSTPAQLLRKALGFAVLATIISLQAFVGIAFKSIVDQVGDPGLVLQALSKIGLSEPSPLARTGYCLGGIGWLFATILRRSVPLSSRSNIESELRNLDSRARIC